MTDTIFFRLLDGVNRPSRLSDAIEELREGGETSDVHRADPISFRQVPGSPFAYWVSKEIRSKFTALPPFEDEERAVKQGLATADDFRFVRAWWETSPLTVARGREETVQGKRWVPFAKGGEYSPYYANVHLVVNWQYDGKEIKSFVGSDGRVASRPQNTSYYFRPGLTWPLRASHFAPYVLPSGSIFSVRGYAILASLPQLPSILGLGVSSAFDYLFKVMLGRFDFPEFIAGILQQLPIPDLSETQTSLLGALALRCVALKRSLDSANESSHAFQLPALLQIEAAMLAERIVFWQDQVSGGKRRLVENQQEMDDIAFELYGIEDEDRKAIEGSLSGGDGTVGSGEDGSASEAEDTDEATVVLGGGELAADLLSYTVGCVFGRWDARIALDPSLAPKLADPFAPLPVCSPGLLVGPDGLPAQRDGIASEEWMRARPDAITPPPDGSVENLTIPDAEYPLAVDWDGILVDDPDHPDDVVRRVRGVLELLWGARADAIEGEACELLGVKDLRAYFRNPRQFFEHHVKRHSKSRRKAPIYWLLQSPSRRDVRGSGLRVAQPAGPTGELRGARRPGRRGARCEPADVRYGAGQRLRDLRRRGACATDRHRGMGSGDGGVDPGPTPGSARPDLPPPPGVLGIVARTLYPDTPPLAAHRVDGRSGPVCGED